MNSVSVGKEVPNSDTTFSELKAFTDAYYRREIGKEEVFEKAFHLLDEHWVKLRQKDGQDPSPTISVLTDGSAIIFGVRYRKLDGSKTEDHFVFRSDRNLYKCKGKELERMYPEYKGTHKLQR